MLDLDDRLNPDDDEAASRPLTPQDRRNGSLFLVTFIVWLPVYLFVVPRCKTRPRTSFSFICGR